MPTVSITSNEGALDSASAVLEVAATNLEYNQPVLRIKQASELGDAASIRIDDPNPDIEFVETGLTGPDPGAGKFEIAFRRTSSRSMAAGPRLVRMRKASIPLSYLSGRLWVAISVSDSRKPASLESLEKARVSLQLDPKCMACRSASVGSRLPNASP
jgi:hypothetical protein